MAGTTNNLSPSRARGRSAGHHHHQSPPPTCSPRNRNAKSNVHSHSTVAATTTALPLHVSSGSSSYSTSPSRTGANQYRNSSSSSHSHMSPSSFNNASHVYGNRLSHVNASQRSALPLHRSSSTTEGMVGDTGYRYPTYSTTSSTSMNPILGDYSSRSQLEIVQRNIQLAAARALEEQRRHMSAGRTTTSASNQRFHSSSSFSNRHSTSTTSQRSPNRGTTFNQTSRDVLRLSAMPPAVNVTSRLPPGAIAVRAQQQSASVPLSQSSLSIANATSTSSNPLVHSQQRQMMQSLFFSNSAAATFQQQFTRVVNVKKEKALQKVQEESKPKTAQEADILSQLRGMGFHDPPTILSAIRTVVSKSESSQGGEGGDNEVMIVPTTQQLVDQTMVFLLSQKEELEEAALLDRARVSSERDKDQTARQALTKEQDLMNCKSEEGQSLSSLMSYFNKSELLCHDGVLNFIRQIWSFPASSSVSGASGTKSKASTTATIKRCNDIKRHIVEVLLLEQKALKWYGNSQLYGAKSFFRHVLAPGIVKEAKVLFRHNEETPKKSKAKSGHPKEGTAKKKRQTSNPTPKRTRGKSSETRTPRKKRSSQSPPSQNEDTGDGSHCPSSSVPDADEAVEEKRMSSDTQQPVVHHPSSSTRNDLTLTPKVVTTFLTYLKGQIDTIKRGLYSLEEQEGNMPKIFVKANRDAKEFGWWSSVTDDGSPSDSNVAIASATESNDFNSDDIEIIEVEAPPPSSTRSGSKGGGCSSSPSKKVEVIELLD